MLQNMQKYVTWNFVFSFFVIWNKFIAHIGISRISQKKYANARSYEPWWYDEKLLKYWVGYSYAYEVMNVI